MTQIDLSQSEILFSVECRVSEVHVGGNAHAEDVLRRSRAQIGESGRQCSLISAEPLRRRQAPELSLISRGQAHGPQTLFGGDLLPAEHGIQN